METWDGLLVGLTKQFTHPGVGVVLVAGTLAAVAAGLYLVRRRRWPPVSTALALGWAVLFVALTWRHTDSGTAEFSPVWGRESRPRPIISPMTSDAKPGRARLARWLTPSRVALPGTVVVVLLLTLPITTLGPGDHEQRSCGNALTLDLERWRSIPDGEYWVAAYRDCTAQRVDRLAWAVGVIAMAGLVVTAMLARARRPDASTKQPGSAGRDITG